MSAGRTLRPWQGAEEPEIAHDRPDVRPGLLPVPRQRARERRRNPAYDSTFVFDNDFAALRPDTSEMAVEDGLLRAEGERGVVPRRLLLAAPRPDPRRHAAGGHPARRRRVGRPDRASSAPTTAGSRCSRTAARRWAPPTRTRTARSGPGRRCPGEASRESASQARVRRRRTGGACCSTTSRQESRRPARRSSRATSGWSSCRSGRPGRSRRW